METHQGPLEYDWRTRFNLPLSAVGTQAMTYSEGVRLVRIIRADPSSMLACAVEGWEYPLPREVAVLMDLFDLQHASKARKTPKPYPRPFKAEGKKERRGDAAGRSPGQVVALIRPASGESQSA